MIAQKVLSLPEPYLNPCNQCPPKIGLLFQQEVNCMKNVFYLASNSFFILKPSSYGLGLFQHLGFANTEKSLCVRLEDYDTISAVVDVFLTKIWDDPIVSQF